MQTNVRSTHRWHPLNREWERRLRFENKSPKTIEVYLEAVWQLVLWLDQLPETPDESADSDAPDVGLTGPPSRPTSSSRTLSAGSTTSWTFTLRRPRTTAIAPLPARGPREGTAPGPGRRVDRVGLHQQHAGLRASAHCTIVSPVASSDAATLRSGPSNALRVIAYSALAKKGALP